MSGERLLDSREYGRIKKEGVCQEDNRVKGISLEMGCFLTLVSLLQVYSVLTYWTIQGHYLLQAAFVQRLILTRSSSPLKCKVFPPTSPEILREHCNGSVGRRSYQPGTIS